MPGDAIGDVERTWDPLGTRAIQSNGFALDTVVSAGVLVGAEGVALLLAQVMPEWLVASYAAVYVGVAHAALAAGAARGATVVPVIQPQAGSLSAANPVSIAWKQNVASLTWLLHGVYRELRAATRVRCWRGHWPWRRAQHGRPARGRRNAGGGVAG